MKRNWTRIPDWVYLLSASAVLYVLQFMLFRNIIGIFNSIVQGIAFIPVWIVVARIVIDRLLQKRDLRVRLEKINMLIGVFFSEIGMSLLSLIASADTEAATISLKLRIDGTWTPETYEEARQSINSRDFRLAVDEAGWLKIKELTEAKKEFLARYLENPNLLEHEYFAGLIRSVLHVAEELSYRKELRGLPDKDYAHMVNDLIRAYRPLALQWLDHTKYLQANYPYLFSLAARMNPFDPDASPVIR